MLSRACMRIQLSRDRFNPKPWHRCPAGLDECPQWLRYGPSDVAAALAATSKQRPAPGVSAELAALAGVLPKGAARVRGLSAAGAAAAAAEALSDSEADSGAPADEGDMEEERIGGAHCFPARLRLSTCFSLSICCVRSGCLWHSKPVEAQVAVTCFALGAYASHTGNACTQTVAGASLLGGIYTLLQRLPRSQDATGRSRPRSHGLGERPRQGRHARTRGKQQEDYDPLRVVAGGAQAPALLALQKPLGYFAQRNACMQT